MSCFSPFKATNKVRVHKGTLSHATGMEPFEGPSPSAPSASSSPIYEIPAVNSQALVDFWPLGVIKMMRMVDLRLLVSGYEWVFIDLQRLIRVACSPLDSLS